MPAFRAARVEHVLVDRPGLQRVQLADGSRAYVLTQLIGPVAAGDRVVVNTTAVDLGLGTGGWHVVHWNLERDAWSDRGPGHVMKLRYTSLQVDTGASEELDGQPPLRLDGTPVVACGLHSQLAAVAVGFADKAPGRRLAYVMTDGAALPLALSDLVHDLRTRGLLAFTVSAGHAFGGDHEAVNVHTGLLVAKAHGADAIVAGIGPGVVGTGTTYGHTGLDAVHVLDAAAALGGHAILAARGSDADARERHRGVSHHTQEVLALTAANPDVPSAGRAPDVVALLDAHGLEVTTMGRTAADDPLPFRLAAAAGVRAAAVVVDAAARTGSDGAAGNVGSLVTDTDVLTPGPPPTPPPNLGRRAARNTVEWVLIIAAALIVAFVVKTFLIQAFYIPSASMEPELNIGDRVLVNKMSYRSGGIDRGDLVVFERPKCD
ncbi:MAG TPA: signal peptidase I, partial [Acidimicrobiales bacterium]